MIQDEQIVVARHERRETSNTIGFQLYTDLLLFAVDEKKLSEQEGEDARESLYGILTLAKVVMDKSEGKVEKIPETLFFALIPTSTKIEKVIEGFRVIRAPKLDIQELGLLGLIFVDLKQKKFMRRFFPDMIDGNADTSEMELFLFRMVTRQPEPPWGFAPPKPVSLPWGFHTRTEYNGYHLTTLYSKSLGMALATLSRDPLSDNVLAWFNILLTLLESLGLDLDGTVFKEVLAYLMNSQHSKPKPSREHLALEMMLRSKELIPLFQNEQIRSEVLQFPHRGYMHKYPKFVALINELGTETIYSLTKKLGVPLSEAVAMIRFLKSRDLVNLQRVRAR